MLYGMLLVLTYYILYMYRPYMYAYYILYVYGQSLVLNAIPCVSMCDNKIYPIHACLLYTIYYIHMDLIY